MSVHVLTTPDYREAARDDLGERWCFRCRARRTFELRTYVPDFDSTLPVDEWPSSTWYGPYYEIRCAHCHGIDTDLFPGTVREWSREWSDDDNA